MKRKICHRIYCIMMHILATFKNGGKTILEGYVILLYVNNFLSVRFTKKNIWYFTIKDLIHLSLQSLKSKVFLA